MNAELKIIKERMKLLLNYPFFGYLALELTLKEEPTVGTLGTDGCYLFYNPAYVDQLEQKKLQAVIAHEVLHCALGHIWRSGEREQERWNDSTDHVVNLVLRDSGFTLPSGGLLDEKFRGMPAEKVYSLLPEGCQCNGRLMDAHDKWGSVAGDLKETWKECMARAATLARMRGTLPSSISALVDDVLQPKLDWRTILADRLLAVVKNNFRFVPPNKMHVWRGIYLPSMYGEQIELGVAVDSSGSVSPKEFQEFIAEIRGITEQFVDYIIYLFFCDAKVHDRMTITPQDVWPAAFPKAGGGTDFRPVFKVIEEDNLNISMLVYLTDGQGAYPDNSPNYPVIWLLNKESSVPWGEKILLAVLSV